MTCAPLAPILAIVLASVGPTPAPTSTPSSYPTISVSVGDRQITMMDIILFEQGMYSQATPKIQQVQKRPTEMPPDSPYVSYQGRDAGPPEIETIWESTATRNPNLSYAASKKVAKELVAAMALALMDAGRAGPMLQAIYASTPSDRASRLALGAAIAQAFVTAGVQGAAYAASEAAWIREHLVPGTSRDAAYEVLRSKNLVAYNFDYIKAIGQPEKFLPSGESLGTACDLQTNRTSGNWPYRNEPLPNREGACAGIPRAAFTPEPDAHVMLWGAFSVMPTCGCRTEVTITFDAQDRVNAVQADKPRCPCV